MKKIRRTLAILIGVGVIALLAFACTDNLDVYKTYGFHLETMPVQKRIVVNETAEIRCTLVREGDYSEARYYMRYFQPDGKGELRLDDGTLLSPNDLYPLEKWYSECTILPVRPTSNKSTWWFRTITGNATK